MNICIEWQKNGQAKHSNYKNNFSEETNHFENRFVRANLPIEYAFDQKTKKMVPYSMDRSLREHKGYSFMDRFGISEEEFYENFTKEDQDRILSLRYTYRLNERTGKYDVLPLQTVVLPTLIKTSPDKLHKAIEENTPIHSGFDGR